MTKEGELVSAVPQPSPFGELVDMAACPLTDEELAPGEQDIPPESGWDWSDPDYSRPPELFDLSSAELDALPGTAPPRYQEPAWPIPATGPVDVIPVGCLPRDGTGGGVGFADGGVLDSAPAGSRRRARA